MDQTSVTSPVGAGLSGWLAGLLAGLIAGLIAVIFSISHATLVTGAAAPHATAAVIGMALIGTAVLCILLGVFSGVAGLVPMAQDVPAAAIGAILVTIVADRANEGGVVSAVEVVVLCLAAGLLFSLVLLLVGRFRMAGLMRYAPRPVLAGFLAGTGYFVLMAALGICLGASITWASLPDMIGPEARPKLLVAFGVATAFFAGERVLAPNLVAGVVIIAALVLFHAVCLALGLGPADLAAAGWTAQLPEGGLVWPPISPETLREVDAGFLLAQIFPISTMILLATAALLMNSSALEAKLGQDLRLDGELTALGASSLVSTAAGGFPGYHGVSTTVAGLRIAGPHRVTSFVAGGLAFVVFFFGNEVLSVLPLPILAGFMLWVGFDFLRDWLWRELKVAPVTEGLLTVLIFVVIAAVGLFEGTVFGLVAGAALFIINYSRLDPVRSELSGDVYHGASEHAPEQRKLLEKEGQAICILKLQGCIFFGTAHRLRQRIAARLAVEDLRFIVLDFEAVTGVDATAVESFHRLSDTLRRKGVVATLTGVVPSIAAVFDRAGLPLDRHGPIAMVTDLDEGLARAQSALFAAAGQVDERASVSIHAILSGLLGKGPQVDRLAGHLDSITVTAGVLIVETGQLASDIYFLESGAAEVMAGDGAAARRVRTLAPGAIVGEIAYYTEGIRSSSVRTTEPSKLWRFSAETAEVILREDPELSSAFHAGLARTLADRVRANTRLIQMLQA